MKYEENIFNLIKLGRSVQLIGLPGSGREEFLREVISLRNLRKLYLKSEVDNYHFVLVSLALLKDKNYRNFLDLIKLNLAQSLGKRTALGSALKEMNLNEDLILANSIKNTIRSLSEKKIKIVFMFDRFEDAAQFLESEFFDLISFLSEQYGSLYILSLTRPIEATLDLILLKKAGQLLSGNEVYIELFDEKQTTEILKESQTSLKKNIPEEIKKELIELTGGYRKMIKICSQDYLLSNEESIKLKDFLLNDRSVRAVSYDIWGMLNSSEQEVLKKILRGENDFSMQEEEEKKYLEKIQILKNNSFTIPLFEKFVRYRVEHGLDDKYKIENDRIYFSDKEISNRFTKLEFRAFKLLLNNQDRVIQREEFIDNVWLDSSSTEGISDQAIDQILHRLRKKIEPDPNNPTHILTVKGRGVMYAK